MPRLASSVLLLALLGGGPAGAAGEVRVLSGSLLWVQGRLAYLDDAESPGPGQSCVRRVLGGLGFEAWDCAPEAAAAMERLVRGRSVLCTFPAGPRRFASIPDFPAWRRSVPGFPARACRVTGSRGRVSGVCPADPASCTVGGAELGWRMVESGWAVAAPPDCRRRGAEGRARRSGAGLWRHGPWPLPPDYAGPKPCFPGFVHFAPRARWSQRKYAEFRSGAPPAPLAREPRSVMEALGL